ncbi:transposase domain-containing protein [Paraburkholderia unamae]|uniref:Uncharacterized protein n=1 Tax=Paraburkholderia unamae TaxID=219649 RepID=A0ABX5KUJ5_9BURK|nr:transposase domain-containing protein [Paraburkholderia unamae]PVX84319.1 hypothetical protein C7402_105160 [Paraburkholderia unamae]
MKTPFDYLADVLERIHARSPIAAYLVALVIAVLCTIALANLNADGSSVIPHPGVHA